ncbi:MAG: hypothetical protein D6712_07165 [Chloroflexi bacterium]|nr:MAG: hypothetical protein D6712_07165 [Chloroflexota bacterium]
MTLPQTPLSPRRSTMPPDHIGVLIAAVLMVLGGGLGLYQLVTTSLPRIGGPLWLFFALLHITVTGLALPVVRYLNVRFTPVDREPPPGGVIVRQAVWVGLYAVTCAWLQIPRVLSLPVAFFLALAFIIIEGFIRSRELAADDY